MLSKLSLLPPWKSWCVSWQIVICGITETQMKWAGRLSWHWSAWRKWCTFFSLVVQISGKWKPAPYWRTISSCWTRIMRLCPTQEGLVSGKAGSLHCRFKCWVSNRILWGRRRAGRMRCWDHMSVGNGAPDHFVLFVWLLRWNHFWNKTLSG